MSIDYSELLQIHAAKDENGKLIGLLLVTLPDQMTMLVFADQQAMPSFRLGSGFVPGHGQTVSYEELKLSEVEHG